MPTVDWWLSGPNTEEITAETVLGPTMAPAVAFKNVAFKNVRSPCLPLVGILISPSPRTERSLLASLFQKREIPPASNLKIRATCSFISQRFYFGNIFPNNANSQPQTHWVDVRLLWAGYEFRYFYATITLT